MLKRVVSKEARVVQITQNTGANELEGSVMLAIQSLQAQISGLYAQIAKLAPATDYNSDGSPDPVGDSQSTLLRLTNNSGAGRNYGEVVVWDPANAEAFTTTTESGDRTVIGVVASDSVDGESDAIPDGEEGLVCSSGRAVALVDADAGAVSAGDGLIAHSTEGYAAKAPAPDHTGIFATALEPLAAGQGAIAVAVRGDSLAAAPAIDSLKDFDHSLFQRAGYLTAAYDTDGAATGCSGFITSAAAWTTQDMSQLIGHWTYGYSADGSLASAVHSACGVDGDCIATIARALDYQSGRLASIIAELAQ